MSKKFLFFTGLIGYLTLLVFSIVFYKERAVLFDMAFHIFTILKDKTFAIQCYRFCAGFTQAFPVITSRLDLSLKAVTLCYSLSFMIYYLGIYLIIILGLKNYKMGIAYLIFTFLINTHTFFYAQPELPQGMALLYIFLAYLDNQLKVELIPMRFYFISAVLLFTVSFAHPLLILVMLFSLIYLGFSYPQKRQLLIYSFCTYLFFYVIKLLFFKSYYESSSMVGIYNLKWYFPNYFGLQSHKNLFHYLIHDYYFVFLLLGWVVYYFVRNRKYSQLILVIFFFTGFIFLVNISYPNGADQIYIENQYLLMGAFLGIPFSYEMILKDKLNKFFLTTIFLIVFVSIIRIYMTHPLYTNRLNWERRILKETNRFLENKTILTSQNIPKDTLIMTWGLSYEFWLLSTLEYDTSRSIIWEENDNEFDWALGKKNIFIGKWGVFEYEKLNKRYFRFYDTNSGYVKRAYPILSPLLPK